MPTNNKKKSLKQIKGLEKAHPYSRKALQMNRVLLRTESIKQNNVQNAIPKQYKVERVLAFKELIQMNTGMDHHDLISIYINRNNAEMESLELVHALRKNRPPPAKLINLQNLKKANIQEYEAGFEVPCFDADNILFLEEWKGDFNAMQNIKMVRVCKVQQ